GRDTVPAAIASGLVYVNRVELCTQDGSRRANLQARGVDAVLANIRHHEPGCLLSIRAELLDELHVPPVDVGEGTGVVVAIAAQERQWRPFSPARREAVPLMAGNLAGLAADAQRSIRKETNGIGHG